MAIRFLFHYFFIDKSYQWLIGKGKFFMPFASMIKRKLHFTNNSVPLTLESKCYELNDISILNGGTIEGYMLNIVSYIAPVKSNVPIIFYILPNIEYLNEERTLAKFSVKLNFTDKSNIQLIVTPPKGVTNYELKIGYTEIYWA